MRNGSSTSGARASLTAGRHVCGTLPRGADRDGGRLGGRVGHRRRGGRHRGEQGGALLPLRGAALYAALPSTLRCPLRLRHLTSSNTRVPLTVEPGLKSS